MKLNVSLPSKEYDIFTGENNLDKLFSYLKENQYTGKFFLVDENVYKLHKDKIEKSINGSPFFILKSGEENKSMETLCDILLAMQNEALDRKSVLIIFGGGVAGDIGGFAASLYMRGIDFIQIPTTLLSQVDSSVGGKTAVNFNGVKNILGTFYQPNLVVIDIDFLKTLEKKDIYSGLGEILKYGYIFDSEFAGYIQENLSKAIELNTQVISKLIYNSIDIKRQVVEKDEKENGLRKILNFGHTIGHGVEMLGEKEYPHGIAIVIGMYYESIIAYNRKMISLEYLNQLKLTCMKLVQLPVFTEKEEQIIIEKIKHDKKNIAGEINMILPVEKGKVENFNDITIKEILQSFRENIL